VDVLQVFMQSISLETMVASVTATRGGKSNRTIPKSSSNLATRFNMHSEPSISEGLLEPYLSCSPFSLSAFPGNKPLQVADECQLELSHFFFFFSITISNVFPDKSNKKSQSDSQYTCQ